MDTVLQNLDININIRDNGAVSKIMALNNALNNLQSRIDKMTSRQFTSTMTRLSNKAESTGSKIKKALDVKIPDIKAPNIVQKTPDASKVSGDTSNIKKQSSAWSSFGRTLSRTRSIITSVITITATLAGIGRSTVGEASDYIEAVNLFNHSMGSYAEQAGAYAQKVQEFLGIDISQWMQQQGSLNKMALGFGMTEKEAFNLSQTMTNLAYDYASFFNTDFNTSFEKIRSALSGQVRPMRQFGVDLTQASLAQTALNHGIKESVSDMSQAEKAYLRAIAIQDAASNVQGDMARTITEPANAMRVLGQLASQAGRAIGFIFIPLLRAIIPVAQAVVIILRNLAMTIANFFHVPIPSFKNQTDAMNRAFANAGKNTGGVAKNLGSAGNSAGKTAKATKKTSDNTKKTAKTVKKIKRELAGFDQLNVLSFSKPADKKTKKTKTPSTGGGGGGGGGVGGGGGGGLGGGIDFADMLTPYDLFAGAEERVQKLVEKIKILGKVALLAGKLFLSWKFAKGFMKILQGTGPLSKTLLYTLSLIGGKVKFLADAFLPVELGATTVLGATLAIAGAFAIIITRIVSVVKNSELFRNGIKAIFGLIKYIIGAIAKLLINIGKFTKSLKLGKETMDGIKDVLAIIAGVILSSIFPPAGALVLIVEGLIIAIKTIGALMKSSGVQEALAKVKESLGKIMQAVGKSLMQSIVSIVNSLRVIWAVLKPVFKLVGSIILAIAKAGLGAIFATIVVAVVAIAKGLAIMAKILAKLIKGVAKFFSGVAKVYNAVAKLTGLPEIKFDKEIKLKATLDKKSKKNLDKVQETKNKTVTTSLKGKNTASSKKTTKAYDHLKDKDPKVSLKAEETKGFKTVKKDYPKVHSKSATITAKGAMGESFKKAFGSTGTGGVYNKPKNDSVTKQYKAKIPKIRMISDKIPINGINTWFPRFQEKARGVYVYEKGGFPDFGQLFIARESGPELVGNIGSKTAVANNEQIVSAVATGVTNAMISAMRQVSSSGGSSNGEMTINVPVYLDNEVVAKGTVKYINGQIQRYGVSPITG